MKLYLIRHGQSEANINHAHAGQADSPLTEKGRQDAISAGKILKTVSFNKVYTSDLSRAACTQKLALPDAEAEKLSLIREINIGKELEGEIVKACEEKYGESYKKNRDEYNFKPYGGENYEMLEKRAEEFLNMIAEESENRIAAFSHGGFINAVLGLVLGCRVTNVNSLSNNCGVSVFEFKDGKWRLHRWNTTAENVLE